MSAKKQSNRSEAIRNAATGYTVVVLAIACFLIALAVIMAGVRIVAGWAPGPTANTTTASAATSSTETA